MRLRYPMVLLLDGADSLCLGIYLSLRFLDEVCGMVKVGLGRHTAMLEIWL